MPLIVDNTLPSPYLMQPLKHGADIVVHSATKFLCGHSDVTGGVLAVNSSAVAEEIYLIQNGEGAVLGPMDSFLLLRGLKTLAVRVDRQQQNAIEIANGVQYGLSSSIYTKDVNVAFKAMRDLFAGITYINAPTIGAEVHLPFGGVKATGNGHREGGIGAIDFYTEWKSVYVDYSDTLQRAQIDRAD